MRDLHANDTYQCPCCDYFTIDVRGDYEICPVCFWEDDGLDIGLLDRHSGPNHISLREARQNFMRIGACDQAAIRSVISVEKRAQFKHEPRPVDQTPYVAPGKPRHVIDGARFSSLEGFARHFSEQVLSGHVWDGNLDAFNDILRGGFGTPDEGFVLIWKNSRLSQERLSYRETVRQLKLRLVTCHPSNRDAVSAQIACAERQEGPTVYDWLVEIIKDHGVARGESGSVVELYLENS